MVVTSARLTSNAAVSRAAYRVQTPTGTLPTALESMLADSMRSARHAAVAGQWPQQHQNLNSIPAALMRSLGQIAVLAKELHLEIITVQSSLHPHLELCFGISVSNRAAD